MINIEIRDIESFSYLPFDDSINKTIVIVAEICVKWM